MPASGCIQAGADTGNRTTGTTWVREEVRMGRWNENLAWKEFRRWLAAAGLGVYVAFSLYAVFFLAEPVASAVLDSSGNWIPHSVVAWIFRIGVILNLIAVIWGSLKITGIQEGEWPN